MKDKVSFAEKIPDPRLLRLAEEAGEEAESVLVEPNLARPKVELGPAMRAGGRTPAPSRVAEPTPEEAASDKRTRSEVERLLLEAAGAPPRWLHAARAFVARLNGAQLKAVAASPHVRAVRPNRRLVPPTRP